MKTILSVLALLISLKSLAQTLDEKNISALSNKIFNWEVTLNTDSLASVFDEKLHVVNSHGETQTKQQYLETLNNGNFKHDTISVEQATATVKNNTALVIGKGKFAMTVSGNKISRHLSYIEVFIKDDKIWKLLAIYASVIPD